MRLALMGLPGRPGRPSRNGPARVVRAWQLEEFTCDVGNTKVISKAHLKIAIEGKMTCLIGPNGGGKSTIVKLFTGNLYKSRFEFTGAAIVDWAPAQDGRNYDHLSIDGKVTPAYLYRHGIEYVGQEPSDVIYSNPKDVLIAGLEESVLGPCAASKVLKEMKKVADNWSIPFEPESIGKHSNRAELQRIALIRALLRLPDKGLLVLDEATSSLPRDESEKFYLKLQDAVGKGRLSAVYVSHRSYEIEYARDDVYEVYNGCIFPRKSLPKLSDDLAPVPHTEPDPQVCLKLLGRGKIELAPGSVLYLTLDSANEEKSLLWGLLGDARDCVEKIEINGVDLTGASYTKRRAAGLRIVPGDRTRHGIFDQLLTRENIAIGAATKTNHGFIIWDAIKDHAINMNLVKGVLSRPAGELSGGYKQRTVLAREIDGEASFLVAFNPFQGIDPVNEKIVKDVLHAFLETGGSVLIIGEKSKGQDEDADCD